MKPKIGDLYYVSDRVKHRGNGSEPCEGHVGKVTYVYDKHGWDIGDKKLQYIVHLVFDPEHVRPCFGRENGAWAVYLDDCDPVSNKMAKGLLKR